VAGERKQQILETLAKMLEAPKREKITTAILAARLDVSEAALYRHFASKAQMFEGLIIFIEETIFGLINKISSEETDGLRQVHRIITMLVCFVAGRWQQFAKSGFKRKPSEFLQQQINMLLNTH